MEQLITPNQTHSQAQNEIHRVSSQWMSENFLSILANTKYPALEPNAIELVRRRQVMDLFVAPGSISAKVQESTGTFRKVSITMPEISDEVWSCAFRKIVRGALCLGKLYSGEVPIEINSLFESCGEPLLPLDLNNLTIQYCSEPTSDITLHIAAVLYRFSVLLNEEPFALLLWRGKGRDEVLLTLRALRRELNPEHAQKAQNTRTQETEEKTEASHAQIHWTKDPTEFWRSSNELQSLEYTIKADELPAALLKWLDPLPLGGLEERIDLALEEAYAHVARRAQAYGLGL